MFFVEMIVFFIGKRYNKDMEKAIREPKQQRSIEKKERIIRAAYELFSEKGYHSTVTSDIAKRAGVSTGIVYGYFSDKRDILFYVLKIHIKETAEPVMTYFNSVPDGITLPELFSDVVTLTETMHRKNPNLHNILHSLAFTDPDINGEFLSLENHITISASKRLRELGFNTDRMEEKVHIAMNLIQSYAHESIYDKHDYIDYGAMRAAVVDLLITLFS